MPGISGDPLIQQRRDTAAAINSVLRQSLQDYELLIVDDDSGCSLALAQRLAVTDCRISVIALPTIGVNHTR